MFQCSWATALCRLNWKLRQIHAEQSMKMSPRKLAENAAVTNARFAALHGLSVAPSPSRRRPFRFANRALVTSGILHTQRMSVVLPSEVCRRRSGCAASLNSFRPLRLPLHAVKLSTEAERQNLIQPTRQCHARAMVFLRRHGQKGAGKITRACLLSAKALYF